MIRIVADDKIPFLKGVLEDYAEMKYVPGKQITREMLKNADALLVRTRTKCKDSLLMDTGVKFIGTATIGFDHIDTNFCEKHKIIWTNAPGCNSASVQQYIAAALLKLQKDINFRLAEKTIGIVGVGNVGSKVEKIARALGMSVLLNDPPRARNEGNNNFVSLDEILCKSDLVTFHVPLNIVGEDATYHLMNEKTFNKMKKGAWFFNTSRGEVSETAALMKMLVPGKLGGAVLDVWENEPDINTGLMEKAFLATPHIAGYSADGKANGTAMVVNSLCRFFDIPLRNWYPDNIPGPPVSLIKIQGAGKSDEEIISTAVFHTYNIEEDDLKLRRTPQDFEKQRGEYPFRREFSFYSLQLKNCSLTAKKSLKDMGFKVIT
jgi:erythronate-4-phosphate dehydrogenase